MTTKCIELKFYKSEYLFSYLMNSPSPLKRVMVRHKNGFCKVFDNPNQAYKFYFSKK